MSSPCDESRCVHISRSIPLRVLIKALDCSSVQSAQSTESPDVWAFMMLAGAASTALSRVLNSIFRRGTVIVVKRGQEINGSVGSLGPHTVLMGTSTFQPKLSSRRKVSAVWTCDGKRRSLAVFRMLPVHVGPAHLRRRDTIARVNLQYADSIIIKKIGSIPEERGPNRK